MKRHIIFFSLLCACLTASTQNNYNDTFKNEGLFKHLVRVKGKLLQEMSAIRKTDNTDTLILHFKYINCLCHATIKAINYEAIYAVQLENCLNAQPLEGTVTCVSENTPTGIYVIDSSQKGDARKISQVIQQISELVKGYTYHNDAFVIRKAILSMESDLRTAIIIY